MAVTQLERPCNTCPFNPATREAYVTTDILNEALARIEGGERWLCHQTVGPIGSEALYPKRRYCAGAPTPRMAA